MNVKDVVIGMKVVPHDKTTGVSLENSSVWKRAQEDQKFLYVAKKRLENGRYIFILNELDENFADGDFYCASDFEPYEEKIMSDEPEWTKGIICNPYSAEAKALIGKEVFRTDSFGRMEEEHIIGKFTDISSSSSGCPFVVDNMGWRFIKAAPEKPVLKEMTVKEICDALGYDVKIKKE